MVESVFRSSQGGRLEAKIHAGRQIHISKCCDCHVIEWQLCDYLIHSLGHLVWDLHLCWGWGLDLDLGLGLDLDLGLGLGFDLGLGLGLGSGSGLI